MGGPDHDGTERTLKDQNDTTYECYGSLNTLREVRLGEPVEARLRQDPGY